jgi:uncharacterized membrane protein
MSSPVGARDAGIMWISNSMLFNWLDRNLEKSAQLRRLSQGKIFLLHSGAFYDVEKKLLEPGELPATLHWFMWQNFATWASGIGLLVVVYYLDRGALLIDPAVELDKDGTLHLSVDPTVERGSDGYPTTLAPSDAGACAVH